MSKQIKDKRNLTEGHISSHIIRLSWPMIAGIFSIILFGLVDAYFVSLLGDDALAAIGYSFPILSIIDSFGIGLGVGVSAFIAQNFGGGDRNYARLIMINALTLSVVLGIILTILGLETLEPLFTFLGASGVVFDLVEDYMIPGYVASGLLFIPLGVNFSLRGHGEVILPAIIMFVSAVLNAALDPLFIFGWGFVPGYGIAGAAYATILSRVIVIIIGLGYLGYRYKIFGHIIESFGVMVPALKGILRVGIPSSFANFIAPFAGAVVTKILSSFGDDVVAAYGLSLRVEILVFAPFFGLAAGSAAFFGQNHGADKTSRIRTAFYFTTKVAVCWAIISAVLLFITKGWIAGLFSQSENIISNIKLYLSIVPISYIGFAVIPIAASKLNATNHPLRALSISIVQYFVVLIPVTYALSLFYQEHGAFFGLAMGHVVGGVIGYLLVKHIFMTRH